METVVARVSVGRWGRNLAIRLPREIVRAAGIEDGERVEIEARGGNIVIRRAAAEALAEARKAADEIIAEAGEHSLDSAALRELLDEGRRGGFDSRFCGAERGRSRAP